MNTTAITLDVPQDTIDRFGEERVKQMVREALVLALVEAGQVATSEIRRMLGYKTHKESRDFLAANGIHKEVQPDEFSADLDMIEVRLSAEG
jgi:hypothetical protein